MKKILSLIPYILIVIFVILLRQYVITPVKVDGNSMQPTLLNNELLLLNLMRYEHNDIERFDIVVVEYSDKALVKRVVGLPGETVEYKEDKLYINNEMIEENFISEVTGDYKLNSVIPDNMYFVMGDNRDNSSDSRTIGLIPKEDIMGEVFIILYPFNKFGEIE